MWYLARIFTYGFIFFAAPPALMNLLEPRIEDGSLFWSVKFLLFWGAIGGLTFLVSALCWHLLKKIFQELRDARHAA